MNTRIIAETLATKERFNTAMIKLARGTTIEPLLLKKLSVVESAYLQKFLDRLEILKAKKAQVEAMSISILVQTYTRMLTQFIADVKNTLCLDPSFHQAKIPLDGLTVETNDPTIAPVLAQVAAHYGSATAQLFTHIREAHTTQTELENGRSMPEFGRVFIARDLAPEQKAAVLVHENGHLNFYHSYKDLLKNLDELILQVDHWDDYEATFGQTAAYFRDGYFRFDMIPASRLLNELSAHFQEFLYVVRFQPDTANMYQLRTIMTMSKELMSLLETVAEEFDPTVATQTQRILADIRTVEIEVQNQLASRYNGKADNALLNMMSVVLTEEDFNWLDQLFLMSE